MDTANALANARNQFSKDQLSDIMKAYPRVAEAALTSQFMPKTQIVGKTIGRMEGDTFKPIYRDEGDDQLTTWQKEQMKRQTIADDLAQKRFDAAERDRQKSESDRTRPKNTAYVSRITGNPLRQSFDGSYLDGETATDPADILPVADFNKQVDLARTNIAGVGRADTLLKSVDDNPSAFESSKVNTARMAAKVPFYGSQLANELFTPKENETRAAVARDAAMIINELYGAALSQGENERAKSFTPSPDDTIEQLLPKLRAAKSWAESAQKGFIPSTIDRAKRQLGQGRTDFNTLLGPK
jgi:hypothetical protein